MNVSRYLLIWVLCAIALQARAADSRPAGQVFDFQALVNLIDQNKISSIEQLVPALPDTYKKHPVLMQHSRSMQTGTPEHPRLILFGDDSVADTIYPGKNLDRLYIGIQTDSSAQSRRPNTVEAIEWNYQKRQFQFHDITFDGKGGHTFGDTAMCLTCHGNPGRPNWTAYPTWPGAFGDHHAIEGLKPADNYAFTGSEVQKYLDGLVAENPRLKGLDFSSYVDIKDRPLPSEGTLLAMSSKVGDQLSLRGPSVIASTPDFAKFKFAFAGAFMSCLNFDEFFPADVAHGLRAGTYETLKKFNLPANEMPASPDDLTMDEMRKLTNPYIMKDTKFIEYNEEVIQTAWMRLLFEGRGMEQTVRNLVGTPPRLYSDPQFSYDFASVADRLTDGLGYELFHEWSHDKSLGDQDVFVHLVLTDGYINNGPNKSPRVANGMNARLCSDYAAKSRAQFQ